ncbi:unnamed protein product [Bubo scandiacus]
MEKLATSLMESLGMTHVCCDLVRKMKEARDGEDIRKEYATCLECRRCLTGSCPHRSEPLSERDLPTLAAILHSVDLLVHEEELQLQLGMGFELVLAGETIYGLGQRLSLKLKRLCHMCAKLRDQVERCFECECFWEWMEGRSAPSSITDGDQALPGDHQFQADAFQANTVAEA